MNEVIYCGSLGNVAEFIYMAQGFSLKAIICEQKNVNSDLLTFSFLRNVEIRTVTSYKEFTSEVDSLGASNTYIMCGFGLIIKSNVLEKNKFFNIHPCTLPDYKGRHPTYHATINGEKYFGITLHEVNTGIDTGNIISVEEIPYYYWMTESDLLKSLFDKVPLLMQKLGAFLDNKIIAKRNEGGNYYPPVTTSDKTIQPTDKPALILNKIRAQSKHGGALIEYKGAVWGIKKAIVDFLRNDLILEKNIFVTEDNDLIGLKISDLYFIRFVETTFYKA